MPNRLINEISPYLLQHAENPVDWYPWGDEALQKAKDEDKPILISIGYSACHWCHVMERESFENEETAALMNANFVNIKIDREERPDLDNIYMDAVQTMTGSGGWPLNVFLTPGAKPFYGGTYFPPERAYNRSSWQEVLLAVANAFHEKRDEIISQAENLTSYLVQLNSLAIQQGNSSSTPFSRARIDELFQNLMKNADKNLGGFGRAPKFPQTFSIQFLLRYYYVTRNEEALKQTCLSLDKMIDGGIYDQLGGGFSRYSTDEEWLVPHFEKMLYDNALLVMVLSEAYQLTKKERYKEVIAETTGFIKNELTNQQGGFYSSIDADSEEEEGKFYVWSYDEVKKVLGNDSEIFCNYFNITKNGNWEGRNILHIKRPIALFAKENNISVDEVKAIIDKGQSVLLDIRNKRIKPGIDNKIVLSWNALMNTACSKAFAATGVKEYRKLATDNMEFIFSNFKTDSANQFCHMENKGQKAMYAFLDDYAFLIQALLNLQQVTGNTEWLFFAKDIAEYVINNFSDDKTDLFFFTDIKQQDVIFRKKEVYDGATPSGNATMAYNIYQLSILFDIPEWRGKAEKMVTSFSNFAIQYPTSFGFWGNLFTEITCGTDEIVVAEQDSFKLSEMVLAEYIPHKVFITSLNNLVELPLLRGREPQNIPLIYLCRSYECLKPVSGVDELLKLINIRNKN
jgi:uncharacterized protein YyaL (SSP411 family)